MLFKFKIKPVFQFSNLLLVLLLVVLIVEIVLLFIICGRWKIIVFMVIFTRFFVTSAATDLCVVCCPKFLIFVFVRGLGYDVVQC